jgi:alkylation response protein AidB-like acyl-CoA dehydrogenase
MPDSGGAAARLAGRRFQDRDAHAGYFSRVGRGRGVRSGEIVEQLYREIRALRIYEGATEVQKLIIGRDVLKGG